MSLFDSLHISVSGVQARANQLAIIGDNIANVNTTGYKAEAVTFHQMLGKQVAAGDPTVTDSQIGGGVSTVARYNMASQGDITATTSSTDIAINGNGFFLVQAPDGSTAMTRAGSFVPDANGNLVNTAGFTLLGYMQGSGGGLQPVNVSTNPSSVTIGANGMVSAMTSSGTAAPSYQIPLATVVSPNNMDSLTGNVYMPNAASGEATIGTAAAGGLGTVEQASLESSSVNVTSELSNLISTESGYEANSKAMTASSDLLSALFAAANG